MLDDLDPRSTDSQSNGARARVLVVNDNADLRERLTRLLTRWWDVEAVGDGQRALDATRRDKPDLILADLAMPRVDGVGLLSTLRIDADLLDVPVMLLSAQAGHEALEEGLRAGADDYLVKPFSARELVARIWSNLSRSHLRAGEVSSLVRLQELSARLTAASDLPSSLQEVLDATIELQGADFGNVQLYDQASGTLRIVAHRGVDQKFLDYFESVDASDTSACGLALRAGARIIIEDVNSHPDHEPHRGIAASTGYRSVQSTPLFDRHTGKPVGMLSTLFREPYRPCARDLRLTDLYARQAADVISSRLAQQRLRESEEHLRLALEAGQMGTWEWDPAAGLVKADAAHQALFGLPPQDQPLPTESIGSTCRPRKFVSASKKPRRRSGPGPTSRWRNASFGPMARSVGCTSGDAPGTAIPGTWSASVST